MCVAIKKYGSELVGIVLCLGLGMLSGYWSHAGDSIWYATINKPYFNPPSWLFAPVWTLLYIFMGIAFGSLWRQRGQTKVPLYLFGLQLLYNLAWSPLFFKWHRIDLALCDSVLLLLAVAELLFLVRSNRTVLLLLLPYLLWVIYATILNGALYILN